MKEGDPGFHLFNHKSLMGRWNHCSSPYRSQSYTDGPLQRVTSTVRKPLDTLCLHRRKLLLWRFQNILAGSSHSGHHRFELLFSWRKHGPKIKNRKTLGSVYLSGSPCRAITFASLGSVFIFCLDVSIFQDECLGGVFYSAAPTWMDLCVLCLVLSVLSDHLLPLPPVVLPRCLCSSLVSASTYSVCSCCSPARGSSRVASCSVLSSVSPELSISFAAMPAFVSVI